MSAFLASLESLNQAVEDNFATESMQYLVRGQVAAAAFLVPCVPLDPLRLEGVKPGNFTARWVKLNNPAFVAAGINPRRADLVMLADGVVYVIDQVQEDLAGGARLILNKAAAGLWGT